MDFSVNIQVAVPQEVKQSFDKACKEQGSTMSVEIRRFMITFINSAKV